MGWRDRGPIILTDDKEMFFYRNRRKNRRERQVTLWVSALTGVKNSHGLDLV